MKLLVILNEPAVKDHIDWHIAIENLVTEKQIDVFQIYPYVAKLKEGLNNSAVIKDILASAKIFLPDIILWAHTDILEVDEKTVKELSSISSKPIQGYWDGDIWQKPLPAPSNIVKLACKVDTVFCQGQGDFTQTLKKNGCKDIRFAPGASDDVRFFQSKKPDQEIKYDIVMIGNNVTSLLPWRTAPGSLWRKEIAQKLYKELGPRFAMYGSGWPSAYGKGPVHFNDQLQIYHSSRLALGTNNWLGPKYYFSNRLPIAMSSGVPVVYNYEEGFDELFNTTSGVSFFSSTDEMWSVCSKLLNKRQEELDTIGQQGFNYAKSKFTMEKVIRYMIEVLKAKKESKADDSKSKMIPNPWIASPLL